MNDYYILAIIFIMIIYIIYTQITLAKLKDHNEVNTMLIQKALSQISNTTNSNTVSQDDSNVDDSQKELASAMGGVLSGYGRVLTGF